MAYSLTALQMGNSHLKADTAFHRYVDLDNVYFDMTVANLFSFVIFWVLVFHIFLVLTNFSTLELYPLLKNNIFKD